jgi:hypothetical protein
MGGSELIAVRTFLTAIEAEIARSALEAAGIESLLKADDCGGLRPHMQMSEGVELLVREEDAEEAERVLSGDSSDLADELSHEGHGDV